MRLLSLVVSGRGERFLNTVRQRSTECAYSWSGMPSTNMCSWNVERGTSKGAGLVAVLCSLVARAAP